MNKYHAIGYAILVGIIIYLSECSPKPQGCNTCCIDKSDTAYVYDTTLKEIPVPYPLPKDTEYVEIPANVDTSEILKDYFARLYYNQTISDSNLVAIIEDSVTQNRIIHRTFKYQWLQPQTVIINEVKPQGKERSKVYVGVELGGNMQQFNLSPTLRLATVKGNMYGVRYGAIDKTYNFEYSKKISLKKQK
jgi:hypothetical protein